MLKDFISVPKVIRIGCRASKLSLIHAQTVQDILNAHGQRSQIVFIRTSGDVESKAKFSDIGISGVFTHELDNALISGYVDIAVHSLKDVAFKRRVEIENAAFLDHYIPNDLCIFQSDIIERMRTGKITLGTSSERRKLIIPNLLKKLLPGDNTNLQIETVECRGNIITRINRTDLDGVVLAYAGVARIMKAGFNILKGRKIMLLPISMCPTQPGQGILCVDTLKSNRAVYDLCRSILHDQKCYQRYHIERDNALRYGGGGCHQAIGINNTLIADGYHVTNILGRNRHKKYIDITLVNHNYYFHTPKYPLYVKSDDIFDRHDMPDVKIPSDDKLIIISKYIPQYMIKQLQYRKIWAPGVGTWMQLARMGIWVYGCSDGLGVQYIYDNEIDNIFGLGKEYYNLTYNNDMPNNIAVYSLSKKSEEDIKIIDSIKSSDVILWSSYASLYAMREYFDPNILHCCFFGSSYMRAKEYFNYNFLRFHNLAAWSGAFSEPI